MAFDKDVTRGQGSFVSRTKKNPRPSSFTTTHEVAASSTYEPTGSFKNRAFLVEAGTGYTLSPADGGDDRQSPGTKRWKIVGRWKEINGIE